MSLPFREHHALAILSDFDPRLGPLDRYLYRYFRANRALGSKDRREVSEIVYGCVRWLILLEALCPQGGWPEYLKAFLSDKFPFDKAREQLPPHLAWSFPEELYGMLTRSLGEDGALAFCRASNQAAPICIRANALKTSRDELLEKLGQKFSVQPTEQSPWGIVFPERVALFSLDAFQQGLFEMQDEGSQLLAKLMAVNPGEQVLDFCAGAGGKALAFAPQMQNRGQIFLHDIREKALQEARQRLKRAGVENAQCFAAGHPQLKKLKKRMDWVLVDVPCSGTGTLRRNPDMKARIGQSYVEQLVGLQRKIFEQALSYLKPGGKIVYATCSVLKEENQEQVEHFMRCYQLEPTGEQFSSIPTEGGMDGFFGIVLKKGSA